MNILSINKNTNEICFIPQSIEDLWTIKNITDIGNIISGQSHRRQKQEDSNTSFRKSVFVSIDIEKYEFSEQLNTLRFTGIIKKAKPDDIAPVGDHHTLEVELNRKYTIKKKKLFDHQIDLLKNSSNFTNKILLIAIDLELANIFILSNISYKKITTIESGKSGKQYKSNFNINNYFNKIYNVLNKKDFNQVILAGPGHTKKQLFQFLKTKNKDLNILKVNTQNISKSSINELFTKPEVTKFLENSIIYKENKLFNKFSKNLGKNNALSIYGLKEIEKAIDIGACKHILILEDLWKENMNNIQDLIKKVEKINANIHIVDLDHTISKKLKSFGGIISILRFRI